MSTEHDDRTGNKYMNMIYRQMRRCFAGVGLFLVLTLLSCSGTPPAQNRSSGDVKPEQQAPEAEMPEEELKKFLKEEQKRRLKPSENSPGPIMISLFTKRATSSRNSNGRSSGNFLRENVDRPSAGNRGNGSGNGTEYRYLLLVSKEWAYENRPVQEPFLNHARPNIKIMRDRKMNLFLKFLGENRFDDFPTIESVSENQVDGMTAGEKILTYWKGDRYRRVYFRDGLSKQLRNVPAWSDATDKDIQKYKNRLLMGYLRAFNAAGMSRMRVEIGPEPSRDRIDDLAEQARPEQQSKVQSRLMLARKLHKQGKHRKAKAVAEKVMETARGTTYEVQVKSLLRSIQQALSE